MLLLPTTAQTPLSSTIEPSPANMVLSKVRSWASSRGHHIDHHHHHHLREDNNNQTATISVKRELLRTPPPSGQRCKKTKVTCFFFREVLETAHLMLRVAGYEFWDLTCGGLNFACGKGRGDALFLLCQRLLRFFARGVEPTGVAVG